ncbi:MAG: RHS repeat-associated core domain-containing protein, partial [Erythrobacter sp.]|nr:RHS repeat-associated core domain-containing protein [Erythrobacter sp.]
SQELYWVHGNHLGVPVVTSNAQGQVVTPANDFLRPGFPGQSEVLADLYHNRARDYDPMTGRYVQADPIGLDGDVNPYVYAGSDPVNMIDPLGLFRGNPADFAPVKVPTMPIPTPSPAGAGSALLGYVASEAIIPALAGAWCPSEGSTGTGNPPLVVPTPSKPDPCPPLEAKIRQVRDELAERLQDFREDRGQLPRTGRGSRAGHAKQFYDKQIHLRWLLEQARAAGCKNIPSDAWKLATMPLDSRFPPPLVL